MGYQIKMDKPFVPITIDGYFSPLHTSNLPAINVFSEINSTESMVTAGWEWWWECVYQTSPHQLTQRNNPSSGVYMPKGLKIIPAANETVVFAGNYHYRFVVKNGTQILKSKCRLYDPSKAGYDSQWNDDGYVPSWVEGTDYIFKSPVYNYHGVVQ